MNYFKLNGMHDLHGFVEVYMILKFLKIYDLFPSILVQMILNCMIMHQSILPSWFLSLLNVNPFYYTMFQHMIMIMHVQGFKQDY